MPSRGLLLLVLGSLGLPMACGVGEPITQAPAPAQTTFPPPPPSGTFVVLSSDPAFGGSVTGRESDLQGTSSLTVTFQMTYAQSISDVYFVLGLLDSDRECLRSQIAYSRRLDGGPADAYAAGTTAVYRSEFFVRDNQQPGCGAGFTTTRLRLTLQDRTQVDPATGQLRTLFWQEWVGGWTFAFAR